MNRKDLGMDHDFRWHYRQQKGIYWLRNTLRLTEKQNREKYVNELTPKKNGFYRWWVEYHTIWKSTKQLTQYVNQPDFFKLYDSAWQDEAERRRW